jgi:hypothetical protein
MPKKLVCAKMFAKLGYCRTLCSLFRDQVVNCSQRSLIMLLIKLTPGASTHHEDVLRMGLVQPPTVDRLALAWFRTLSALQAKPRCPLDGFTFRVPHSLSVVGCYTSVWSYYLVRALKDVNCYLPH